MLIKALCVAIAYYLCCYVQQALGIYHFNRPIIICTIIGLLLGDLRTGIILGATFESLFLGVIAVGGAVPADASVGATIGAAVSILSNVDANTAMTIAVPVSMMSLILMQLSFGVVIPMFLPKVEKYAKEGNAKGMVRTHWIMSIFSFLFQAIVIFVAIRLGVDYINKFLAVMPSFVTRGFAAAGSMLPAVGFGLLLNVLFDKKIFAFYFLGFLLVIYLGLPSIAIAIFAAIIAITYFFAGSDKESNMHEDNEKEAFFE